MSAATRKLLPRFTLLAVGAVAGAALGGCGATGNDDVGARPGADGVRDVVSVYATALADGDGGRACSLMSMPAQEALKRRANAPDCLQGVRSVAEGLDAQSVSALRDLEVGEPRVGGEKATVGVKLTDAGRDGAVRALGGAELHLVRIDARWHIDAGAAGA